MIEMEETIDTACMTWNQGQCEDDDIFQMNKLIQHNLKKKKLKHTIMNIYIELFKIKMSSYCFTLNVFYTCVFVHL